MKKLIFLLGAMALFFTTSCLQGGGIGGSTQRSYRGKLVVTSLADPTQQMYEDTNASVIVSQPDITEQTLNITFNGVKFHPAMSEALTVELKDIPFKKTISSDGPTGNHVFDVENIIPTGFDEQYMINHVWGTIGETIDIYFEMQSKGAKVYFTTATSTTEEGKEENNE